MSVFIKNFRKWWQPPRRAADRPQERSVTFLELFYDLVYVALVAQLAHALAENVTLSAVLGYIFLFIIVWWAWLNGATYHDVHGNNDIRTRVFTFLQMFTVAAMAVFASDALGEGAVGFALSYAAFQLILTYLWWRTGVHDPDHRPLSGPYSLAFLLTTVLFIVSVFVPGTLRFYLWGIALLISLLLPLNMFRAGQKNPVAQRQVEQMLELSASLVERYGLLTIIVLGEVVVGTVNGVAGKLDLTWQVGLTAALGMLIAIGIWWIYFDFVSMRKPQPTRMKVTQWIYLHLPMTLGIAALGTAVFNVVEHSTEPLEASVRWLLVGAIALVLLCIALLMQAIQVTPELRPPYRRGGIITLICSLLILLLGFTNLAIIPLLIITIILMLVPVFYGIKVWILVFGAEELQIH